MILRSLGQIGLSGDFIFPKIHTFVIFMNCFKIRSRGVCRGTGNDESVLALLLPGIR